MSKLKTAEEWADIYFHSESNYDDLVTAIKEAQRNAIEVALGLVARDYILSTELEKKILNLKNSEELKV